MVGGAAEEDEVARLRVRDAGGGLALVLGGAGQADADLAEDVLREAGAVEAGRRAGAAVRYIRPSYWAAMARTPPAAGFRLV